jgi:hypothetical protein
MYEDSYEATEIRDTFKKQKLKKIVCYSRGKPPHI